MRVDSSRLEAFHPLESSEGPPFRASARAGRRARNGSSLGPPRVAAPSAEDLDRAVDKAHRDRYRDLSAVDHFVESVNIKDPMTLSNIRDVLYHFEDMRTRLFGSGSSGDSRVRREVKRLLQMMRGKSEKLAKIAAMLEAEGEVDDGGDDRPTVRNNICLTIDIYDIDAEFRNEVKRLCEALDTVRSVVLSGEDEYTAFFRVTWRLNTIRAHPAFASPLASWGIATLLGEERRWVTKQLSRRVLAPSTGNDGHFSREDGVVAVSAWVFDRVSFEHPDPELRETKLGDAYVFLHRCESMDLTFLSLDAIRTTLAAVDHYKKQVAELIISSDPAFRGRIRQVLNAIKETTAVWQAAAAQKVAAGEVDDSTDFSSRRTSICKYLDELSLPADIREDVRRICDSLDKMHQEVMAGRDMTEAFNKVIGRLTSVTRKAGYGDSAIFGTLERLYAEEWRWLHEHLLESRPG